MNSKSKFKVALISAGILVLLTQYNNCGDESLNTFMDFERVSQQMVCSDPEASDFERASAGCAEDFGRSGPRAQHLALYVAGGSPVPVINQSGYIEVQGTCNPSTFFNNQIRWSVRDAGGGGCGTVYSVCAQGQARCENGNFYFAINLPGTYNYSRSAQLTVELFGYDEYEQEYSNPYLARSVLQIQTTNL